MSPAWVRRALRGEGDGRFAGRAQFIGRPSDGGGAFVLGASEGVGRLRYSSPMAWRSSLASLAYLTLASLLSWSRNTVAMPA